ncbi:secreted RxLR effector protein 161-like [Impatiens glandulifera]|uniref:secreted RxLR effector protein 161-like n=1 Tax=Impatiens glandulifera TaxID=253017 RepID=UPI001FB19E3A|nr:secreted RxLR effector protein 161-like [Impatiens glandulifera]
MRLRKFLYRPKQAPRAWNERIDEYFKKNEYEHVLYTKKSENDMMVFALYVDDLIFTGSNAKLIKEFKEVMKKEFEMTDLGLHETPPNVECWIASRFMEDPSYTHWNVLKKIMRYVRGTLSLGLFYSKSDDYRLMGYSDSDWCGDVNDRKNTLSYVFLLKNATLTWLSNKQPIVTLWTCEAEYVTASWSVCHAVWISDLLRHLRVI